MTKNLFGGIARVVLAENEIFQSLYMVVEFNNMDEFKQWINNGCILEKEGWSVIAIQDAFESNTMFFVSPRAVQL